MTALDDLSTQVAANTAAINQAIAALAAGSTGNNDAQLVALTAQLAASDAALLAALGSTGTGGKPAPVPVGLAVTPTQGAPVITFATPQTLADGAPISFASQPGVGYVISGAVANATNAVLATAFTGPSGPTTTSAAPSNVAPPVPFGLPVVVALGSPQITFLLPQTLQDGQVVGFANQPDVKYTIKGATTNSTTAMLPAPFTGSSTNTTTNGTFPGAPQPGAGQVVPSGLSVTTSLGSSAIMFATPQTLADGAVIAFASQPGTSYAITGATSASLSALLSSPFNGAPGPTTTASAVATMPATPAGLAAAIAAARMPRR